ncbi:MAG: hypothetical protein D3924_00010 [Candidatus Electrothrix sp. AR4]|nr:hypothetical protein [Candidatus Electrothrix sp. AR4]
MGEQDMERKSSDSGKVIVPWLVILLSLLPAMARAESLEEPHPIDLTHGLISGGLLTSAHWLDSFFGDEDYIDEQEYTRIRIKVKSAIEDGKTINLKTSLRMRLSMPQLNERVTLFFDSNSADELTNEEASPHQFSSPVSDKKNRTISADLRYYAARMHDLNLRFSTGLYFHDFLPNGYLGLRYRQNWSTDSFQSKFTQNFRWYDNRGWESKTGLDFECEVFSDKFLRLTLEGNWDEHTLGYPHALTLSLFQPLSLDQALEYSMSNYFLTRPSHDLSESLYQIRYRYRFLREWLVFEVAPRITWRKKDNHSWSPGIIFLFEIDFG